jgi:hypothetical protein
MARKPSPAPKSKRRKVKPARAVIVLPEGPYLDEGGVVTSSGLQVVELLAAGGAPQSKIASALGMPFSTFKKMLGENDHDNPLRLTWERGRSDLEFEVATILLDQARGGQVIAAIFYGKSQLNWVDAPQPTQQVGIQIVVPDSLDRVAFEKRMTVRVLTDQSGGTQ